MKRPKGAPHKSPDEKKRSRSVRFDPRTWADIEAYCQQKNISEAEAIRQLVRESLGGIYRVS